MQNVKQLIGCEIKTHYGTGGIVTRIIGPFEDGNYTIVYKHSRDGSRCWINTIKCQDGIITCENIPLQILGRVEPYQITLEGILAKEAGR